MLLDSNIIIYASKPEHHALRRWIAAHASAVSAISYVEVLGFPKLTAHERVQLEAFFEAAQVLPLSPPVLEEAVRLRQVRKMSLGDALIAGTALIHGLTLVTHNVSDFTWVADLMILNPVTQT